MNELVAILEVAQKHYVISNSLFRLSQETEDEDAKELYWDECQNEEHTARGLLQAYEIMTGREIYTFQIKEELQRIA